MQDYRVTRNYYLGTIKNLFQSFWARFGWNHIRLTRGWYYFLALASVTGVAGAIWGAYKYWSCRPIQWKVSVIWLAIAGGVMWVAALARQSLPFWESLYFIPSARYAYPAMIPTMLVIAGGWVFLANRTSYKKVLTILPIVLLVALDISSLLVIIQYYS
ncbi:MAG: hypothetical protein ACE5GO_06000 [Anaerolineales bacterium]